MAYNLYRKLTGIFFLFLFLFTQIQGLAQDQDTLTQQVKVKAYVPIVIGDSVYKFQKDTVLYLPSNLFNHDSSLILKSDFFYKNLQDKLQKNRITKEISNLLLVKNRNQTSTRQDSINLLTNGMCFENRIVRSIKIVRMPPFGSDVKHPYPRGKENRVEKYANGVHSKTKEKVISKNIIFNIGDAINHTDLSESERLLRALPFIKDAEIYACDVDGMQLDIYIFTQDQWTIGVDGNFNGTNDFELGLYDNNFIGTGQYVYLAAVVKTDEPDPYGYAFKYKFQNVYGTFVDLEVNIENNYLQNLWNIKMYKDFVTSSTKWAGEVDLENNRTRYGYTTSDSAYLDIDSTQRFWEELEYSYASSWVGRSFQLNKEKNRNITISGGVAKLSVLERPEQVSADTLYAYQNKSQYLGSVTFNERNYRKLSYLQGFGRTEDVPNGWLFSVTSGTEINEFLGLRPYLGFNTEIGQFTPWGFFRIQGEFGSFIVDKYKQETFHLQFNYFSNLLAVNDNFLRFFLDIDLLSGTDRVPGDYLFFDQSDLYTDFQIRRNSKKGTQRLRIKQENVWFTKWFFYGFKFAVFQNFQFGMLNDKEGVSISHDNFFSSIGAGIRTRNENLVFNTFALEIQYYPNANFNNSAVEISLSTEIDLPLQDFKPMKPNVIPFQ
ncbi:hypothetical protein EI427_04150 [Flammeovirga pectinis]|uniref:Bacterial surface antigen (D15) domain-containing protein n=1 Tax=Flammeovirga pectinis TaxID=2494373 RepID=A0A3S9NZT6_9BACT|nr:hypothetical protein [Flammeovirga pectinis]AZQ61444.1 hypothetical protein EI427_04150 [Flammeovirga pectinis]